jgi:AraC-like DNA-binding protein
MENNVHNTIEFNLGKSNQICHFDGTVPSDHKRREEYHVFFTGEDSIKVYLNKRLVELSENTILFVAPNCLIAFGEDMPVIDVLYFTSTFYNRSQYDAEFLQNSPLFPSASYFSYQVPDDFKSYVHYVLGMLYRASKNINQELYRSLIHNFLEQMLIQCTLHGTQGKPMLFVDNADHVLTTLFKEYVTKDIRKSRTVKYYADKLNITPRRLSKATQNVMGKTPKDALTDFVISQFKWQLLYTEKSIKEIGWEYGFLDENNFSSFFYKEVGITPKEFRRSRIIQK